MCGHPQARGQEQDAARDLVERVRVEGERLDAERAEGAVAARNGADLAQILGHDEVGRELRDQVGVDGIEGAPVGERIADGRVDRRAGEVFCVDSCRCDDRKA